MIEIPEVCYHLGKITFDILVESLIFKYYFPKEFQFIYIIAPWVHDLPNTLDLYGFNFSNIFSNSPIENDDISSISTILKSFINKMKLGSGNEEVVLVTQAYNCSTIKKNNYTTNLKEAHFLKDLLNNGVLVLFHPDLHAKIICTSQSVLAGSANLTFPGFYQHTEHVSLHRKPSKEYFEKLERVKDIIYQAKTFLNKNSISSYLDNKITEFKKTLI